MTSSTEPNLAAPGAGLPALERFVARSFFAWYRFRGSRETFSARFLEERAAIAARLGSCPETEASRRVLIRRLRGLEDSSRYWSVWMTLDHLRIVNHAFASIISALTQGVLPAGRASTAAVKPSPEVTGAVVAAYEQSCEAFLASGAAAPSLRTALRYSHPWFGPLDAAGWHALGGVHLGLHRVQIERIIAGLAQP